MKAASSSVKILRFNAHSYNGGSSSLQMMTRCYSSSNIIGSSSNGSGCSCCGMLFCNQILQNRRFVNSTNTFNSKAMTRHTMSTSSKKPSTDIYVEKILEGNKKWVAESLNDDPDFFNKLGQVQKPKFLYFGCSDSRVPANEILGLGPGEVFVHRNIGNLVPGNDLSALSVLEYAVGHLNVTDIIVTGHYDCGAVRAATSRQDLGILENWLRLVRDVYRLHKDHLDHLSNDEERHYRLVELNVVEQCLNIYKTGVVQRKRMQSRAKSSSVAEITPRIHGMVFNPADGILKKLKVDFDRRVGNLDHIYGLYENQSKVYQNSDAENTQ